MIWAHSSRLASDVTVASSMFVQSEEAPHPAMTNGMSKRPRAIRNPATTGASAWPARCIVEYVLNQVARRSAGAMSEIVADMTGPMIAVAEPCTNRMAINAASARETRPSRSDN